MSTSVGAAPPNEPDDPSNVGSSSNASQSKSDGPAKIDAKALGVWGFSVIVLGNIATFLGSVGSINEQVQKIQKQLNLGTTPYLLYAVLGVVAGGYLLSFTSFYVWIKLKTSSIRPHRTLAIVLVVLAGTIAAAAANFYFLRHTTKPELIGSLSIWREKLVNAQNSDQGGFTIMLDPGPSNPVQVFASAQSIVALEASTNWADPNDNELTAIRKALQYIDSKRSADEGCWGYFDNTQPLTEVCAWVTIARVRALEHGDRVWPVSQERTSQMARVREDLESMSSHYYAQTSGWSPFEVDATKVRSTPGCSTIPPELAALATTSPTRTYSAMMAVWALIEAHRVPQVRDYLNGKYDQISRDSIGALLQTYQDKPGIQGFVPNPNRANQKEQYLGLTAQTITVLYLASQTDFKSALNEQTWLEVRRDFLARDISRQLMGENSHLSDVDAYVFPYPHPLEPITFLWSPWTLLAYKDISEDTSLSAEDRKNAVDAMNTVVDDYTPSFRQYLTAGLTYEMAENLFALSTALQ